MKKLRLLSIAVLAAFTLAACNKNDGTQPDPNGESDFYLKLSQAGTRAITDQFDNSPNSVYTTFQNGAVLFVDDAGNILHPVLVGNDNASVKPSQLQAGYTFIGVSNKATKVVVVANIDFGPSPSFSTLDKLREDYKTDLKKQVTDEQGNVDSDDLSVDYATMWGEGTIYDAPAAAAWDKQADVKLSPVTSRFELWKMTAKKYTDDNVEGIDADYIVDGIYLNNYYFEVGPDGQAKDAIADIINHGNDWTKYFPSNLTGNIPGSTLMPAPTYNSKYNVNLAGIIYDLLNQTAVNHVAAAGNGKTWAYNAFANSQATPHIVIKLSNVKQNGTPRPNSGTGILGTGYITINRYVDTNDGSSIYPMENGVVYSIENLPFTYSDITDLPEPGGYFSVNVKVAVQPWRVQTVGGGIAKE